MEIMSVAHFPPCNLSDSKLEKLVVLSGNPEDVEFCLPYPEDKDYQKSNFCVRPTSETTEWPYSWGQWHSASTLRNNPARELSSDEASLLSDLSLFYSNKDVFPLCYLIENLHALANWGLFLSFLAGKIDGSWKKALFAHSSLKSKMAVREKAPHSPTRSSIPRDIPVGDVPPTSQDAS